jgi:hypothetical protein
MREIADVRVHGTTGEAPLLRFQRDEAAALQALGSKPLFRQVRELIRRVQGKRSRIWSLMTCGCSLRAPSFSA